MLHELLFSREQDGADGFEEGFYLLRREDHVDVPVRVWFGVPIEPTSREPMDRAERWQIEINGTLFGDPDEPPVIGFRLIETLEGIWPEAKRFRTDERDYRFRVDRARWAREHDVDDPFSNAGRVDPMTAPLPFLDD